jgi:hypothetical protein
MEVTVYERSSSAYIQVLLTLKGQHSELVFFTITFYIRLRIIGLKFILILVRND